MRVQELLRLVSFIALFATSFACIKDNSGCPHGSPAPPSCEDIGTQVGPNGTIRTIIPGQHYGKGKDGYNPNAECSWHIKVDKGYKIRLAFDRFEFALGDHVLIYDSPIDDNDQLIATLTGFEPSGQIFYSESNWLTVKMISYSYELNTHDSRLFGFSADYQQIPLSAPNSPTRSPTNPMTCKENHCPAPPRCPYPNIYTDSGVISSPNYPNQFPAGLSCNYFVINTDQSKAFRVDVTDWDVDGDGTSLEIFHGYFRDDVVKTIAGTSPGSISQTFYISQTVLSLTFNTTQNHPVETPKRGFSAKYEAIDFCPGAFENGTSGTITSPFYPAPYPVFPHIYWYRYCFYHLKSPEGMVAQITFDHFYTNANQGTVKLINGLVNRVEDTDGAFPIAELSGSSPAGHVYHGKSQHLTVFFSMGNDNPRNANGFHATWKSVPRTVAS
uniref:CUB domain-containing protein n=1 Tax=Plectus sambesii TaxID=2011161 RepID=A0A914USN7_9BILA